MKPPLPRTGPGTEDLRPATERPEARALRRALALARARAVLRGGSPRALAALPLRSGGVLLAALAVRIALYLPPLRASALVAHAGGTLYIASLGLALVGTLRNRGLGPPVWMATLGLALNATVIVANAGYMPVDAAALRAVRNAQHIHDIADAHVFNNITPGQPVDAPGPPLRRDPGAHHWRGRQRLQYRRHPPACRGRGPGLAHTGLAGLRAAR